MIGQVMTLFLSPVFCFVVKCVFQTIAQNFIKEAQAKYKDKIVVEVDFTSEAFKLDDSGIFSDCCCQQNWSGEGS